MKIWYDKQLLDQQQGFRSGRGTTDGIFITKRIQQVADKTKKRFTYCLSISRQRSTILIENGYSNQLKRASRGIRMSN